MWKVIILKKHFWDVRVHSSLSPFFVLFKERKFNMKPIQIVTLLSEIFYLLSDSFILKCIEKGGKKNNYVKIEGLRNVLFISIMNTETCFSRRIGLIKSFTIQASSYLFLSLELQYLAFVIKWTWYPYLVWQLELVKWRIISFYETLSN